MSLLPLHLSPGAHGLCCRQLSEPCIACLLNCFSLATFCCRYVDKRFLARPPDAAASPQALQEWLWEAAQRGDVRGGKFPH